MKHELGGMNVKYIISKVCFTPITMDYIQMKPKHEKNDIFDTVFKRDQKKKKI